MRVLFCVFIALFIANVPNALAEMDPSVILLAKEELAELQRNVTTHALSGLLEKRGTPANEYKSIIDTVLREYASCVIDGLEADDSPISQAAILFISDGYGSEEGRELFESAFTEEEIDEYVNSFAQISVMCTQQVYERNYLITPRSGT